MSKIFNPKLRCSALNRRLIALALDPEWAAQRKGPEREIPVLLLPVLDPGANIEDTRHQRSSSEITPKEAYPLIEETLKVMEEANAPKSPKGAAAPAPVIEVQDENETTKKAENEATEIVDSKSGKDRRWSLANRSDIWTTTYALFDEKKVNALKAADHMIVAPWEETIDTLGDLSDTAWGRMANLRATEVDDAGEQVPWMPMVIALNPRTPWVDQVFSTKMKSKDIKSDNRGIVKSRTAPNPDELATIMQTCWQGAKLDGVKPIFIIEGTPEQLAVFTQQFNERFGKIDHAPTPAVMLTIADGVTCWNTNVIDIKTVESKYTKYSTPEVTSAHTLDRYLTLTDRVREVGKDDIRQAQSKSRAIENFVDARHALEKYLKKEAKEAAAKEALAKGETPKEETKEEPKEEVKTETTPEVSAEPEKKPETEIEITLVSGSVIGCGSNDKWECKIDRNGEIEQVTLSTHALITREVTQYHLEIKSLTGEWEEVESIEEVGAQETLMELSGEETIFDITEESGVGGFNLVKRLTGQQAYDLSKKLGRRSITMRELKFALNTEEVSSIMGSTNSVTSASARTPNWTKMNEKDNLEKTITSTERSARTAVAAMSLDPDAGWTMLGDHLEGEGWDIFTGKILKAGNRTPEEETKITDVLEAIKLPQAQMEAALSTKTDALHSYAQALDTMKKTPEAVTEEEVAKLLAASIEAKETAIKAEIAYWRTCATAVKEIAAVQKEQAERMALFMETAIATKPYQFLMYEPIPLVDPKTHMHRRNHKCIQLNLTVKDTEHWLSNPDTLYKLWQSQSRQDIVDWEAFYRWTVWRKSPLMGIKRRMSVNQEFQITSRPMPTAEWKTNPLNIFKDQLSTTESQDTVSIPLSIRLKSQTMGWDGLSLAMDDLQMEMFNPVMGKPTRFQQATLWKPILMKMGLPWVQERLNPFGYKLEATPSVIAYTERRSRIATRLLAPNYPLTDYEKTAYYQYGPRQAEATLKNPETGELIWKKGKSYHITPSWERSEEKVETVDETEQFNLRQNALIMTQEAEAALNAGTAAAATPAGEQPSEAVMGEVVAAARGEVRSSRNIEVLKVTTERYINHGCAVFLVEDETGTIHRVRETTAREDWETECARLLEEQSDLREEIQNLEQQWPLLEAYAPQNAAEERQKEREKKRIEESLTNRRARVTEIEEEVSTWKPLIDEFKAVFPPEAPATSAEMFEDELKTISKRLYQRFAPHYSEIKQYQLRAASLGVLKRTRAVGDPPGAGKTLTSIMIAYGMDHHYNLVVCPTLALKSWAREIERCGFYHEIIGFDKDAEGNWDTSAKGKGYAQIEEISKRFANRERKTNKLGRVETEFYIISAELVALGGAGNLTYYPWHMDYLVTEKVAKAIYGKRNPHDNMSFEMEPRPIPQPWTLVRKEVRRKKDKANVIETDIFLRVWSDRESNAHEIAEAGWQDILKAKHFRDAVEECPVCEATGKDWSNQGHCRKCNHRHSTYTTTPKGWTAKPIKLTAKQRINRGEFVTAETPAHVAWKGTKRSNRQYPAYKLLSRSFGVKIEDEIHQFSSFTSAHGKALQQLRAKDAVLLSGTLCRTQISELEPSLCQLYTANSGEFPYSSWEMSLFREQFATHEIQRRVTDQNEGTTIRSWSRRRETGRKIQVPEASNLTRLRALLHGIYGAVPETEMERVWKLKPINEDIIRVRLSDNNEAQYQAWQEELRQWHAECIARGDRAAIARGTRQHLNRLAYACDGIEKLDAAMEWIRTRIANNQRYVIAGPSRAFYTMLLRRMKQEGLSEGLNKDYMTIGDGVAPDARFGVLDAYRDSTTLGFVSRTRLINVNFNQLTCASWLLVTGLDPSPSALRQLQKRLNRVGRREEDGEVMCNFLLTELAPVPRRAPRYDLPPQLLERLHVRTNHTDTADRPVNIESAIDAAMERAEVRSIAGADEQLDAEIAAYPAPPEGYWREADGLGMTMHRPPSYEEKLFALILRREAAIKQVLNQTERYRGPQELFESLQSRQTLNQLLTDIITTTLSGDIEAVVQTPDGVPVVAPTAQDEINQYLQRPQILEGERAIEKALVTELVQQPKVEELVAPTNGEDHVVIAGGRATTEVVIVNEERIANAIAAHPEQVAPAAPEVHESDPVTEETVMGGNLFDHSLWESIRRERNLNKPKRRKREKKNENQTEFVLL